MQDHSPEEHLSWDEVTAVFLARKYHEDLPHEEWREVIARDLTRDLDEILDILLQAQRTFEEEWHLLLEMMRHELYRTAEWSSLCTADERKKNPQETWNTIRPRKLRKVITRISRSLWRMVRITCFLAVSTTSEESGRIWYALIRQIHSDHCQKARSLNSEEARKFFAEWAPGIRAQFAQAEEKFRVEPKLPPGMVKIGRPQGPEF